MLAAGRGARRSAAARAAARCTVAVHVGAQSTWCGQSVCSASPTCSQKICCPQLCLARLAELEAFIGCGAIATCTRVFLYAASLAHGLLTISRSRCSATMLWMGAVMRCRCWRSSGWQKGGVCKLVTWCGRSR